MVGRSGPLRWRQFVAGFVATMLVLAACGGSDYKYVANSKENLFFKLPRVWTEYKLTDSDKDGRAAALPAGVDRIWHYGYDAAVPADPVHLTETAPEMPIAEAGVWQLSTSSNDRMSLSKARTIAFGLTADPLLQEAGTPAAWEVVPIGGQPDVRLTFPKGVTGTRVAINVPNPDDPTKFHTIDATTVLDPTNGRMYILKISCSAQCYLDNRKAIDGIAESWTVNRS